MDLRRWSDEQLVAAVEGARSWRGVCRALGLKGNSAGVLRSVQRYANRLQLDTSHFTYQRRWSDQQLRDAIRQASTWADVLAELGLVDRGETRVRVKGHAVRLGLEVSQLQRRSVDPSPATELSELSPDPSKLRVAAESIAIAWFTMRDVPVAIPTESCPYDLLVTLVSGVRRIQVKSGTGRTATGAWKVTVGRRPYSLDKAAGIAPYDPDSVDYFFVIDGAGMLYLIPSRVIAGLTCISTRRYSRYRVGDASSLFVTAA